MADVILLTGASSDLGGALLARLAKSDAVVYAHYARNHEKLERRLAELRPSTSATFIATQADFAVRADVDAMIARIRESHGRVNKIVHLPALPLRLERFADTRCDDMARDFDISVRSLALIAQAFLPALVREKTGGGRVVVALSSVTAGVPPKGMARYVTVKYALLGLVRALAAEFAPAGITVNSVSPYTMETPFLAELPHKYVEIAAHQNPTGRNATPDDVAPLIEFLLSDAGRFITGANVPVSGGAAY